MSYLELLVTIYVSVNTAFIIFAIKRDGVLVDKKVQMDSILLNLNETQKSLLEVSRMSARQKEELFKLRAFYNSHNANKAAEVNNDPKT